MVCTHARRRRDDYNLRWPDTSAHTFSGAIGPVRVFSTTAVVTAVGLVVSTAESSIYDESIRNSGKIDGTDDNAEEIIIFCVFPPFPTKQQREIKNNQKRRIVFKAEPDCVPAIFRVGNTVACVDQISEESLNTARL